MQGRFFDGQSAVPRRVTLAVEDGTLLIGLADGRVDWALNRIVTRASPGGAATLRYGHDPARLVVDDPASLLALRPHIRHWPRPQRGWRFALAAAGITLAAAALFVVGGPALLAPLVPAAWEDAAGRGAEAALVGRNGRCRGLDGQRALERFMAELTASANLPAVRLVVVDDPLVNAFTLPGHRIVVERGLIDAAEDGEELAGVLGHEAGHIAHRDPVKALIREVGLSVVAAALGWTGVSSGGMARTLLDLSYGRSAESAADAFSVKTLHDAGLRADGLGRFFAHMQGRWADGPSFLSDHPATAERRALVAQPPGGGPAFSPEEWQAIRAMCHHG